MHRRARGAAHLLSHHSTPVGVKQHAIKTDDQADPTMLIKHSIRAWGDTGDVNELLTASRHNDQALLKVCQLPASCALAHNNRKFARNEPS